MTLSKFLKEQISYNQDVIYLLIQKKHTEGLTEDEEIKLIESITRINFIREIQRVKRESHT